MTDLDAVRLAVLMNPEDDAPRLEYASLVEETDPELSEFIRIQLELASHGFDPFCPGDHYCGSASPGNPSCEFCVPFKCQLGREHNLLMFNWIRWSKVFSTTSGYQCWNLNSLPSYSWPKVVFSRGFVGGVRLAYSDWHLLNTIAAPYFRPGQPVSGSWIHLIAGAHPVTAVVIDQVAADGHPAAAIRGPHRRGALDLITVGGDTFTRRLVEGPAWTSWKWPHIEFFFSELERHDQENPSADPRHPDRVGRGGPGVPRRQVREAVSRRNPDVETS